MTDKVDFLNEPGLFGMSIGQQVMFGACLLFISLAETLQMDRKLVSSACFVFWLGRWTAIYVRPR